MAKAPKIDFIVRVELLSEKNRLRRVREIEIPAKDVGHAASIFWTRKVQSLLKATYDIEVLNTVRIDNIRAKRQGEY